jgi:hypothetical protein
MYRFFLILISFDLPLSSRNPPQSLNKVKQNYGIDLHQDISPSQAQRLIRKSLLHFILLSMILFGHIGTLRQPPMIPSQWL